MEMPDNGVGGHVLLNHKLEKIHVTRKVLRALDIRHYLYRHRETGLLALKSHCFPMYQELECGDQRTFISKEVGREFEGLSVADCRCDLCRERNTKRLFELPDEPEEERATRERFRENDEMIKEVKGRRRYR